MRNGKGDPREGPDTGKSIVVIGGYGAVGSATAVTLGAWFPGRVVVAGRDLAKATELARSTKGALQATRVDVSDPTDVDRVLDDAAVVVMCVERANAAVAEACLRRGVHYVDISASDPVIEAITSLDSLALRHQATAVLSVGLAPGLTNLLAHHCVERLPSATTVDISLLLGLGGDHGVDSVRWIVEQFSRPEGRNGSDARPTRIRLAEWGTRTVHPFPFSDQYVISRSLQVWATTRICFDSAFVTSALFGLRATRFFTLMRRFRADSLLTAVLSRVRLGSDRFAVDVTASDARGGMVSSTVTGRDVCQATSMVTAHVARVLFTDPAPPGVLHIDRLLPAGSFIDELDKHLMTVEHT
ncbi:hypothetical protein GCM10022226_12280 [Sphaerisporangium flaviroseum]|uniref:Saccharopine dehydrogenase NADP binding domain-containing protein n=1 Tax=Sphaerisporangium flaviroseum TaxID=509199 RepID=A0ABP7HKY5_9ACTN